MPEWRHNMFEIKNMDIYIYPRYLIKNLSLTLNKGDKLAIIVEEGNGEIRKKTV